jgi:hypothetical protein
MSGSHFDISDKIIMQDIFQGLFRKSERQQPLQFLRRIPHREITAKEKLILTESIQKFPKQIDVNELLNEKTRLRSFCKLCAVPEVYIGRS